LQAQGSVAGVRQVAEVEIQLTGVGTPGLANHTQLAEVRVSEGVTAGNVHQVMCPGGSTLTGVEVLGENKIGFAEKQILLPSTSEIQIKFGAGLYVPAVFDTVAEVSLTNSSCLTPELVKSNKCGELLIQFAFGEKVKCKLINVLCRLFTPFVDTPYTLLTCAVTNKLVGRKCLIFLAAY